MPGGIIAYLNFLNYLCRGFPFYVEIDERILLTALLGLFLTVPGIVRSQGFDAKTLMRAQQRGQTGSLYGNNPFEQPAEEGEEGEQQPQDTTKKERKIRKPLESYFSAIRSAR